MIKWVVGGVLLLGLGVCSFAQGPVFDIPKMDGIVVDGKGADWGNNGFRVDILAGPQGETVAPKDFDAKARLGWNERGLLVLVTVQDDVPMETEKLDDIVWQDCVEMYVGTKLGAGQYYQAVIAPGMDPRWPKMRTGFGDLREKPGPDRLAIDAAAAKTAGGYVVECCLPWSNLGVTAREGGSAAIQVMVNDADDGAKRFSVAWHPSMAAWGDPSAMQALRLAKKPSAPVQMLARAVKDDSGRRIEVVAPAEFVGRPVNGVLKAYVLDKTVMRLKEDRARATLPAPAMQMAVSIKDCGEAAVDFDKIKDGEVIAPNDLKLSFQPSVFSGTAFPPCVFDNPEQARKALGTYTIKTTFYDADLNEVKTADKVGRYGAVVNVTGTNGRSTRRFVTLYHTSHQGEWWRASLPAQGISLPAEFGVDSKILNERNETVSTLLMDMLEASSRAYNFPAIVLSALHETQPGGKPWVERTGPYSQDQNWWFRLKKKIGLAREDYFVHLPASYDKDPSKRWPLVLFLHGSGERGDNLAIVDNVGLPLIAKQKPDFPFIVIAPQCPANEYWNVASLNDLLDRVMKTYRVDEDRVYLTGLSMGGYGTWALALESPERFAAIVPICGGGDPGDVARLKDIPTWVFHGGADDVVPTQRGRDMVEALRKLEGRVRYTEYPGVGHDSWTRAYAEPELYDWLLQQKRGEPQQPRATGN